MFDPDDVFLRSDIKRGKETKSLPPQHLNLLVWACKSKKELWRSNSILCEDYVAKQSLVRPSSKTPKVTINMEQTE